MVDRLRALLDRPLDPSVARTVLAFASAILVGVAALFILAASEPYQQTTSTPQRASSIASPLPAPPAAGSGRERHQPRPSARRQDPQDLPGSAAARRASHALRSHRALQHVPYREGELRIDLVGARGRRAVLRVSASTVRAAGRDWCRFLRRYRDSGRAYVPIFAAGTRTKGRP